jgi:polyisoprenoid-binding protein YceI
VSTGTVGALPTVGVWDIDSRHSTMRFSVRHHAVASFRASFYPITGSFDAASRKLVGEVRIADIQVPIEPLRKHLQTPDFFDGEQHPTITFESTAITANGSAVTVEGDLTMKGVTKRVTATGAAIEPVSVMHQDGEAEHFGIDLSITIDRREFGLDFNNQLPAGIFNLGWDVQIDVALEFIKSADT